MKIFGKKVIPLLEILWMDKYHIVGHIAIVYIWASFYLYKQITLKWLQSTTKKNKKTNKLKNNQIGVIKTSK